MSSATPLPIAAKLHDHRGKRLRAGIPQCQFARRMDRDGARPARQAQRGRRGEPEFVMTGFIKSQDVPVAKIPYRDISCKRRTDLS